MNKFSLSFLVLVTCFAIHANAQSPQIWGLTSTGAFNGDGSVIKINEDATGFTNLYSLYDSTGSYPRGNLTKAANNMLYGMTNSGGLNGVGAIFSFNSSDNSYNDIHDFNDTLGASPNGSLLLAPNRLLYGMTEFGGANGFGVLFSFDPSTNTYSDLYDFNDTLGGLPFGSLIQASNGIIYGMTFLGGDTALNSGSGCGVIFSFDLSDSSYNVLHKFNFNDGAFPRGSLLLVSNNKLYGMTGQGGADSSGELFSLAMSDDSYTSLHDFNTATGTDPFGSLIQATDGKLYGMANEGGVKNMGVIFSIDTLGNSYSDIHDFDTLDGANPYGDLLQASNGALYGMTFSGGVNNSGIIFSFNTTKDSLIKLFDLNDTTGTNPYGALIELPANTGIQQLSAIDNGLLVFPNPAASQISILCSRSIQKIRIENSLGQNLFEKNVTPSIDTKESIGVSNLPAGLYFITITSQNQTATKKLIISR